MATQTVTQKVRFINLVIYSICPRSITAVDVTMGGLFIVFHFVVFFFYECTKLDAPISLRWIHSLSATFSLR